MPNIRLNNIHKYFGNNHVLNGISFDIESGEFISIIGESGCGKTTLLKIISGLLKPEFGEIYFDDEIFNFKDASKRSVGFIFQDYTLYPNLTVFDNVLFSLKKEKESYETKIQMVYKILDTLGIRNLESAFPKELSFGQQQKVSIAKNLIKNPSILLFDEPLSNIDEAKRFEFRKLLKEIKSYLPETTFIYVSHNFYDCINLSNRIIYIDKGVVKYSGDIQLFYKYPIEEDSVILSHSEAKRIDATLKNETIITNDKTYELDNMSLSLVDSKEIENVVLYTEGKWFSLYKDSKCLFNIENNIICDARLFSDEIIIEDKYRIDKSLIESRLISDEIKYACINTSFIKYEKENDTIEFNLDLVYNDDIYQVYDLLNNKIVLRRKEVINKIYYPISKLSFLDDKYLKVSTIYDFSNSQKDYDKKKHDISIIKKKGYKKYIAFNLERINDKNLIYYNSKNYKDYVAILSDIDIDESKKFYVKE